MRYGNCLTGAAILMWKERNNNPRFMLKTRPGTKVPHFMVKSDEGLHHYKKSSRGPWATWCSKEDSRPCPTGRRPTSKRLPGRI